MNLIIDIGNTRTKLAFFKENAIDNIQVSESKLLDINRIEEGNRGVDIIVSSVKNTPYKGQQSSSVIFFDKNTLLPIENLYKSASIGMDRLASAVGASVEFPNRNCLIIDLGSAITIDFLSESGVFEGGNISLGMAFRFKALHNFTSKLPLVDSKGVVSLTSKNTEDAIRSGVVNSILFELEAYIDAYRNRYSDVEIILTGGDGNFFAKQLKKRIFANENLVLIGLNRILNFNVNKK